MQRHSRIAAVAALCLALLLAAALVWAYAERKALTARYDGMDVEIYALQSEQRALRDEIAALTEEYQLRIDGSACLTFVCTELTESVFTEIYPIMQAQGYCGMLAVSQVQLPGEADCITLEQCHRMMADGWEVCLLWDGEIPLEQWLPQMQECLQARGFAMPQAVYFERDTYTGAYDALLAEYDVTAVIHHQEEGLPCVSTEMEEGMQHIGAVGWNQTGASDRLAEAAHSGGVLVFTIGEPYVYGASQFGKMLDKTAEYSDAQRLLVAALSAVKAHRLEAEQESAAPRAELEAKIALLTQEITALDEKIHAVYDTRRTKP